MIGIITNKYMKCIGHTRKSMSQNKFRLCGKPGSWKTWLVISTFIFELSYNFRRNLHQYWNVRSHHVHFCPKHQMKYSRRWISVSWNVFWSRSTRGEDILDQNSHKYLRQSKIFSLLSDFFSEKKQNKKLKLKFD